MKCQSYFPMHHSHYDLNIDANGGASPSPSPMYINTVTSRSGPYNEYVVAPPPLSIPRGPSLACKELLRRTMLLQEDTFKDQVQELHRLYRRQKELMGEIKCKYMYMNHLHIDNSSSNLTSEKISVKYGQNSRHDLPFTNPCSTHRENIQTSLNNLNDPDLVSKGKKVRGKLLDLELPAEVYIDSDEEEPLQATPPTSLFSNKRARVLVDPDVKPSVASRSLNSVLQRELPNFGDLNEEPLEKSCLEASGGTMTMTKSSRETSQVGPTSSGKWVPPHLIQALPSLNSEFSSTRGAKNKKIDASQCCTPKSRVTISLKKGQPEYEKSVFLSPKNTIDLNNIDLNSVDVSNQESKPSSNLIFTEGETMKIRRWRLIDINLPCDDPTVDDEPCDLVEHECKNLGQINLNFYSGQTRLEINLEAPISPEVEERPPPRGDSEENQSDSGFDPLLEPTKIAAETIVSLSSSQYKITDLQNCEASNNGNLEWFAGVISSFSIDLDNDFETIGSKDTCSIDDYEAMTLELTEMKVEDYLCKTTVTSLSTENCSMLVSCQTRKGRARRSKRKDFQREVLPSLASLSRYEVSEDIQLIEGLMEAAGTPWQLSRTRRVRKPRAIKQQTIVNESPELTAVISPRLTAVMNWGKVKRRCRGRRSCASPSVLSKWLKFGSR